MSLIDATTAGARMGVEDEPDRVGLAADRERVDLERRARGGDRLADLEHVRAEAQVAAGVEVVGVVLHERDAAGQPAGHDLHRADHRRGLPVALGAEPVAVAHEPLDGQPGELRQAVEVLEGRRERRVPRRPRGTGAGRSRSGRRRGASRRTARPGGGSARPRTRRGTCRSARRPRRRWPRRRGRRGRRRRTC